MDSKHTPTEAGQFVPSENSQSHLSEAELLNKGRAGDRHAYEALLLKYRGRLKRMIRLRLARQLHGRLDASDILQDAYVELFKRLGEYVEDPNIPFFIWVRHMTGLKLAELHRRHLGTQMRDAQREVSLHSGPLPEADSISLAAQLLGHLSSPSQVAIKMEMRLRLQETLNSMEAIDREIIAMRHFEQMSVEETAASLGLSKTGASSRYVRAITRLKKTLMQFPEFNEQ